MVRYYYMNDLPSLIAQVLEYRKWSQVRLAKELKVTYSYVNKLFKSRYVLKENAEAGFASRLKRLLKN